MAGSGGSPGARALGRLLLVPPTWLGVTLVTFVLVHLAPGDAASLRAGEGRGVTAAVIAENRALAGLDRPLGERYLAWLGRSAALDFGHSLGDGRPVRARIVEALPRTAGLSLLALALALAASVPLGALAAARHRRPLGRLLEWALLGAYGVPAAAVALLLLRLGAPWGGGSLSALLAPALCLAYPAAVVLAQQERGALLAALRTDFARTARAKGASPARVLVGHALRNALLPLITLAGAEVPALLSGSVVVERVFGVRGLGLLGYDALVARDYPVLMGLATVAAGAAIAGTLVADLLYLAVDPRLHEGARFGSGR